MGSCSPILSQKRCLLGQPNIGFAFTFLISGTVAEIDLIAYENHLNCEHYTIQNVIMAFNCSSFVLLIDHVSCQLFQ